MKYFLSYQRLFFAPVLAATLILTACGDTEENVVNHKPTVTTLTIEQGLKSSYNVTGEVQAIRSADLKSDFKADVVEITKSIGERVKKGDVIAKLSSKSVESRYSAASRTVGTANQNINSTQVGTLQSVRDAEIALEHAERNLYDLQEKNKTRRTEAKEIYDQALLSQDLSLASADTQLNNTIRDTSVAAKNAIDTIDKLLEYSQQWNRTDDLYKDHIGVIDNSFQWRSSTRLAETYDLYSSLGDDYNDALAILTEVEDFLNVMLNALRTKTTTSNRYPQSALEADVNELSTRLTAVKNVLATLKNAKRSYESTEQQTGENSQVALRAEASFNATIASLNAEEADARRRVESARSAIESARASASITDVSAKTSLNAAQSEYESAKVEYNKLTVTAPFDGMIVALPLREGQEVGAGELLASFENRESLKIVAFLSSREVRRLRPGDRVQIGNIGEATIATISPSADPVTKKYSVEILYESEDLKPGEFINLTFYTSGNSIATDDDHLYAPISAVHLSAASTYVWIIEDTSNGPQAMKREVEIGDIVGDSVQILSGLRAGNRIVFEGNRNLSDDGTFIEILDE